MNISGTGPVQPFVTVSPYSPLGKPVVGQESPDTKDKPLPPVEATEASNRLARHRIGEDAEGDAGGHRRSPDEDPAAEQAAAQEGDAPDPPQAPPALESNALGAQLAMRARIDRAGHADPPPAEPRLPPGGFEPGTPPTPGALFDQKI